MPVVPTASAPLVLLALIAPCCSGRRRPGRRAAPAEAEPGRERRRAVFFASDGMRPDLMEKYAKAGAMPTYKELMKTASTGDNGMLQAFPPNTGVGWYTMATGAYPAEHGSTNNTFFRAGDAFTNRTSFSAAGVLQADTIANAAERAGKKVAQIDWVGGAAANIAGPDRRLHATSSPTAACSSAPADPVEQAGSAFFGVTYQVAAVAPAVRLDAASRPAIRRPPPKQTTLDVRLRRSPAQNPNRDLQRLLLRQRRRRRASTYDHVDRQPGRQDRRERRRSTSKVGDFLPLKLTGANGLIGARAGQTAGHYMKLISLAPDAQPVQALPHVARARDRDVRRAVQRPARRRHRRGPAREVHRRQLAAMGGRRLRARSKPASSTRTPTSSRAATSSGPTASRSSTTSSGRSSPTPTSRWSATRSPTRSRTSSWRSSRRPTPTATRTRATTSHPKFDDIQCTGRGRPAASRSARATSAAPTRTPTRSSASRAS